MAVVTGHAARDTTHRSGDQQEPGKPALAGIFAVKLPVRDLAAARAWYERVFDLRPIFEFPDDDGVVRGVAYPRRSKPNGRPERPRRRTTWRSTTGCATEPMCRLAQDILWALTSPELADRLVNRRQ